MEKLITICLCTLLFVACVKSGKDNSDTNKLDLNTIKKSENKIESSEYITKTGKIFVLSEDHSIGVSISNLKLVTHKFEEINDSIELGTTDPVEDTFLADLDNNGFEEFYITTRSAGSGSYSTIYGFASNRDKSVSQIYIPEISAIDKMEKGIFEGYRGHNTYSLKNGEIVNSFPMYRAGDTNANPTGGKRLVRYTLIAGEAGWVLEPKEIIQ